MACYPYRLGRHPAQDIVRRDETNYGDTVTLAVRKIIMQVIKLYLPMEANNGHDLMCQHVRFIDELSQHSERGNNKDCITGFTRFEAEGFWFGDRVMAYKDNIKIYEFHVSNENMAFAYPLLKRHAETLCRTMEQECIYLQVNNDTELVK